LGSPETEKERERAIFVFRYEKAEKESFSVLLCKVECLEEEPIPCHCVEDVQLALGIKQDASS
jgi:hypothetical protein